MRYKVGDEVHIRTWGDMESEFGLNESGSIRARGGFVKDMSCYCGKTGIVEAITENYYLISFEGKRPTWKFSDDMIDHHYEDETFVASDALMKYLTFLKEG